MTNPSIKNAEAVDIVFERSIYANKQEALEKIEKIKGEISGLEPGSRLFIINHELVFDDTNADMTVGIELKSKLSDTAGYSKKTIKFQPNLLSIECASGEIDTAKRRLEEFMSKNPCQIIGSFYEIYDGGGLCELIIPICPLSEKREENKFENFDVPFENDEQVIGKWESVDIVPSSEQFNPKKIKMTGELPIKDLYFLPQGEKYWIFRWTKGILFSDVCPDVYPGVTYANFYAISTIGEEKYLFLAKKSQKLEILGGLPVIWVFKKVSSKHFSAGEIAKKDDTNLEFCNDENVLGKWKVKDFVRNISDFKPDTQNCPTENLYFKSVQFQPGGYCALSYKNSRTEYNINWTKGALIYHIHNKTESYEQAEIGGKQYLFIQWKSGDYIFGGARPWYYVFER